MPVPLNYQDLSRFSVPPGFRGRPAWFVQFWNLCYVTLFRCSPQIMYGWRRWLLRRFGARVGRGVLIRPDAQITYPWKVSIGDYAWIGNEVVLYSLGDIHVGHHAVVSQRSYLCTAAHRHDVASFDLWTQKIIIEDQAWVATDVFIGPGVTVGRGAVVGARSTVFADLPGGMICYGSPAKAVRPRNQDTDAHPDSGD